jgi:ParB family chromosome partitioning protein
VAARLGRKRSSIANTLRFLKLPDPVQEMIRGGTLTSGHAKALLAFKTEAEILKAAERMAAGDVTVREAEEIARTETARPRKPAQEEQGGDPNVRDAELRLQRALGTKVRIRGAEQGKGRIEIDFYSTDELERLFDLLEGGVGNGI